MKSTKHFQQAIKAHLDKRAQEDELFAKSYAKECKTIKECCDYIISEVHKTGCTGFTDDEIFGIATHYYDEDNLKVGKAPSCRVAVNCAIELTEEEMKQAREEALQKFRDEQYASMKKKPKKQKKEQENVQQMSLF